MGLFGTATSLVGKDLQAHGSRVVFHHLGGVGELDQEGFVIRTEQSEIFLEILVRRLVLILNLQTFLGCGELLEVGAMGVEHLLEIYVDDLDFFLLDVDDVGGAVLVSSEHEKVGVDHSAAWQRPLRAEVLWER